MAPRSASICLTCVVTWVLIYIYGLYETLHLLYLDCELYGLYESLHLLPEGGAGVGGGGQPAAQPADAGPVLLDARVVHLGHKFHHLGTTWGTIIFRVFDVSCKGNINLVCNCFFE